MQLDPGELVAHYLRAVPIDEVMGHLARVAEFDRYQASLGIEEAAAVVAQVAHAAGVEEVAIERHPADGAARWWSFQAPVSWTPTAARLVVRSGESLLEVDHARDPFSIATCSAPTSPEGVTAPLVAVGGAVGGARLAGAIAVVERGAFSRPALLEELATAGALGFVTDVSVAGARPGVEHAGRIELPPGTPLFGFSVTGGQLAMLRAWAERGAEGHARIRVDRSAAMPVVTGVLPGHGDDREVWLTAHLCHPRPGANDNASGVAALLGIAAAHAASRRAERRHATARTLRFVWGPEFVGMAATLHGRIGGRLPSAVINLDMVGEDQALCGGPFLVERPPDSLPSLAAPLGEHLVAEAFARTRAGAGRWSPAQFTGFSDHALFADPRIGVPAVQLCHAPDRFNHSSGDALDKVSPVEMLRATAAGAALARVLADDSAVARAAVERVAAEWCGREEAAARRTAHRYRAVQHGAWGRGLVRHVARHTAAVRALAAGSVVEEPGGTAVDGPVVSAGWSGPFNARGVLADLPPHGRAALSALLREDKLNYARLLNFAVCCNGRRTRAQVVGEASFSLRAPVEPETAEQLFGALLQSGWVVEEPEPSAPATSAPSTSAYGAAAAP